MVVGGWRSAVLLCGGWWSVVGGGAIYVLVRMRCAPTPAHFSPYHALFTPQSSHPVRNSPQIQCRPHRTLCGRAAPKYIFSTVEAFFWWGQGMTTSVWGKLTSRLRGSCTRAGQERLEHEEDAGIREEQSQDGRGEGATRGGWQRERRGRLGGGLPRRPDVRVHALRQRATPGLWLHIKHYIIRKHCIYFV